MEYNGTITINLPDSEVETDFSETSIDHLMAEVREKYPDATSVVIAFTWRTS